MKKRLLVLLLALSLIPITLSYASTTTQVQLTAFSILSADRAERKEQEVSSLIASKTYAKINDKNYAINSTSGIYINIVGQLKIDEEYVVSFIYNKTNEEIKKYYFKALSYDKANNITKLSAVRLDKPDRMITDIKTSILTRENETKEKKPKEPRVQPDIIKNFNIYQVPILVAIIILLYKFYKE